MSIDMDFYSKDVNTTRTRSASQIPFSFSEKEQRERKKIEGRISGLCLKEFNDYFDCMTSSMIVARCIKAQATFSQCKYNARERLEGHYEEIVRDASTSLKEQDTERRLILAEAERKAHTQHVTELREAARRQQMEKK